MKRIVWVLALSSGFLTTGPSAWADDDDDRYRRRDRQVYRDGGIYRNRDVYRDDDFRRGRGRQQQRGGMQQYSGSPVARVLQDLRQVQARNRNVDSHERQHFQRAQSELYQFEQRLREGRFDSGKLNNAMEDIQDLSQADQIHPRDRQLLAQDLRLLYNMRSNSGGYNSGGYGYRY